MKSASFRHTADGAFWGFLAEALILPTGLITTAYLTRTLGPERYGLFTLTSALVIWLGFSAAALLSRTSIKLVAEADDWSVAGTTVLRAHVVCGFAATIFVLLMARPIARLLDEPRLATYLAVFALEPLILVVSRAHANLLVGMGQFRKQAVPIAWGSIARLVLVVTLVQMGFSIIGALVGILCAAFIELVLYRRYVSPRWTAASGIQSSSIWVQGAPVLVSALCLQLFSRIDLFALAPLGRPIAEAGFFSAAQNLSIVPGLFGLAFTPLLLASMTRLLKQNQPQAARRFALDALRVVLGMLPFAGLLAGAAHEIAVFVFGAAFAPAGSILAVLIFGKVAVVVISVAVAIMIAAERPGLTVALAAPILVLAVIGHVTFIPRFGMIGAAWVTSGLEIAGALVASAMVYRVWNIRPSLATIARGLALTAAAYFLATLWPSNDAWLIVKAGLIALAIPVGYLLLGELGPREVEWARAALRVSAKRS